MEMPKLRDLLNAVNPEKNDDYKLGWRDAICYTNDHCKIAMRKTGEPIDIVLNLDISEDRIVSRICKLLEKKQ